MKRNVTINQTQICNCDNCTQIEIIHNDGMYTMQTSYSKREGPAEFTCSMPEQKNYLKDILCKIVELLNGLIGWILNEINDD